MLIIEEVFLLYFFFLWQGQLSLATTCVKHKPKHSMIYKINMFSIYIHIPYS